MSAPAFFVLNPSVVSTSKRLSYLGIRIISITSRAKGRGAVSRSKFRAARRLRR
jgi:hypothetical protein